MVSTSLQAEHEKSRNMLLMESFVDIQTFLSPSQRAWIIFYSIKFWSKLSGHVQPYTPNKNESVPFSNADTSKTPKSAITVNTSWILTHIPLLIQAWCIARRSQVKKLRFWRHMRWRPNCLFSCIGILLNRKCQNMKLLSAFFEHQTFKSLLLPYGFNSCISKMTTFHLRRPTLLKNQWHFLWHQTWSSNGAINPDMSRYSNNCSSITTNPIFSHHVLNRWFEAC